MMRPDDWQQRTVYYRGRNVEELTRDELMTAVKSVMWLLEDERAWNRTVLGMEQTFDEAAVRLKGQ